MDPRWRTISSIDKSMAVKFGPSANDIKWGKKIPPARPQSHSSPLAFRLDPYGAKLGDSFATMDRNRAQVFARPKGERFQYRKQFGRDFTRVGQVTNVVAVDTQALDHKSIRSVMSSSATKWL